MNELDPLLRIARQASADGAELLAQHGPGSVHSKADRDFVTELDLRIQQTVRQFLRSATPDIGFRGEEDDAGSEDTADTDSVWMLDPIDGTSNFIHGLPLCAISLALMRNGRPVIGVIRAPQLNLEYYASERGGAFGNGQPIAASCTQHLRESIVSIGDYAVGANSVVRNKDRFAIAQALATTVERVRMFGSAALDLAWVAEGRTDGCVIMSNKPWDMAAGVLIARESGATVMDSDGTPHSVDSRHTLAANRLIAPALQKLVMDARTGVGAEADRER